MFKILISIFFFTAKLSIAADTFRAYEHALPHIKLFYQTQHKLMNVEFVKSQREQLEENINKILEADLIKLKELEKSGNIKLLSIWDALLELDNLIDVSDPDTSLPNSQHALQTAEAMRLEIGEDQELDWLILVALLHDIGKVDALLRNIEQWAVVGDTFPVGCKFSKKNIFYEDFKANADFENPDFNSKLGIYSPHIGLKNILMSYGHDEYAYQVLRSQSILSKKALNIIRFHSFYPLHKAGAYRFLLDRDDEELVILLQKFSTFDLYSKNQEKLSFVKLENYYKKLINKYFPPQEGEHERLIAWPILKSF